MTKIRAARAKLVAIKTQRPALLRTSVVILLSFAGLSRGAATTSPPPAPAPAIPAPPTHQPIDVDPSTFVPYNLPPASRQRMRLCGERWRDLKMTGKSNGLTWRSFANKCLPGQD